LRVALIAATVVCAGCGTVAIGQKPAGYVAGQGVTVSTAAQAGQSAVEPGSARNRAGAASLAGNGQPGVIIRTGTTQPRPASTSEGGALTNFGSGTALKCGARVGKIAPMCPVGSP
ncbi:MAG TPA: hypothetical protein VET26_04695, partial [Candidatus Sulfotelmatobacter sp.]|nr:hypothetical protein [Candidatus Sulfotelmatobacter sp.]